MSGRAARLLLTGLLMPAVLALPAPPPDANERINVSAKARSALQRAKLATVAMQVITREELLKHGDSNIAEVLRRQAGVSLGGAPGQGDSQLALRGLAPYTLVLLNGDPLPRGFSLDNLRPDEVERIEILRAPMAEFSAQAVAGTINIILRQQPSQRVRELRLTLGATGHRPTGTLGFSHSDQAGSLSYGLAGSLQRYDDPGGSVRDTLGTGAGQINLREHFQNAGRNAGYQLQLVPKLNWQLGEGETISIQPFLLHGEGRSQSREQVERPVGAAPPYASAEQAGSAATTTVRSLANWQLKLDEGRKLNARLGFNYNQRANHNQRAEYDARQQPSRWTRDDSAVRETNLTSAGKWSAPYAEQHAIALGWDMEWIRRAEQRTRLENDQVVASDFGDDFEAETRKLAAFAQDEITLSDALAAYAGVRWEGVQTASTDAQRAPRSETSVWSPMLHGVWRYGDKQKDQLRASLTRSYRAPSTGDLIARPLVSDLSLPTSPDRAGNPDLKPELAWGLDVSLERYLPRDGVLTATVFRRNIKGLIRRQTVPQDGRWVSIPVNGAGAVTHGLELEARFALPALLPQAPALDVRTNLSRYWSQVEGVPGPDNRLGEQLPLLFNLGLDYRPPQSALSLGGNLNWVPAAPVRTSASDWQEAGRKRVLDLYAAWRLSSQTNLRLSASNLLAEDYASVAYAGSNDSLVTRQQRGETARRLSASLETRF